MKIALATTTVHVPHALKLMRKCGPDVKFFVAGDEKSPHSEIIMAQTGLGNYDYLFGTMQDKWKCSGPIGWNTLARRNIAFLEALKWGADLIVSWDNDNIPTDDNYFENFARCFEVTKSNYFPGYNSPMLPQGAPWLFSGIQVEKMHPDAWFDPGRLLIPGTRHRGFPHHKMDKGCKAEPVTDAKIGVAAGLVIGDPDIDATTRIEKSPHIGAVHLLGQTGIVVDLNTWTVFNSQNTAVIRELIPAWFMMPGVNRHDDIYASLIVQRVARERGYHVHFGSPFTYQQRNDHDLLVDLRREIDGMGNVEKLAGLLDSIVLPGKSVVADTRIIYEALCFCEFIPQKSACAGLAWLEDVETVL